MPLATWDIKEGITEVESEGVGVFSNTKVSCLEIKASTAVWLVLSKHKVEPNEWVNAN